MDSESVKQSTLSGLRWFALKSVVGEVVGVTSTVALARLVTPVQFGYAAVALVFNLLAVILTFEGFAAALVQRAEITERHKQASVFLNLVGGGALMGFVLLMVPIVWRPIFGSETAKLIALTSPSFLIAGIGSVARALLWRRLDFRRVTQIDLLSTFGGNVVAVVMAVLKFGAVALVVGADVGIALTSVLMLLAAPEPLPRFHLKEVKDIVGYGVNSAFANIVSTLTGNVDYAIVAARLGAYQTGIYYRAFNLGVIYQSKVSNVMMQLAFPVYSRLETREDMRRFHERAVRVHAATIFPLLTLLIIIAPVAIPFVFGPVWRPAVVPTQILAGAGMVTAMLTGYSQVLQAAGRPQTLLRANMAILVVYSAAVLAAVDHGLIAVAAVVVAVYIGILGCVYQFLLGPHLGLSLRSLVPELGPALGSCIAMATVALPLRILIEGQLPPLVTIAVVAPIAVGVYASVLRLLFRPAWNDLVGIVARTLPPISRLRVRKTQTVPAEAAS